MPLRTVVESRNAEMQTIRQIRWPHSRNRSRLCSSLRLLQLSIRCVRITDINCTSLISLSPSQALSRGKQRNAALDGSGPSQLTRISIIICIHFSAFQSPTLPIAASLSFPKIYHHQSLSAKDSRQLTAREARKVHKAREVPGFTLKISEISRDGA